MAQGPTASSSFGYQSIDDSGDDLPRTFRREKEARAREAEARAAKERAANPSLPNAPAASGPSSGSMMAGSPSIKPTANVTPAMGPQISVADDVQPMTGALTYPATVKRFDVPFLHLMMFFLKAVIAAIPALVLLAVVFGLIGSALGIIAPNLMRLKILIGVGS